ncbi:MAG: DNA polymerase IV [Solirubrobacteraceae bacterium]|nr:DNA polymerase IV [Solirubrobacteraceae bacterium]
MSPPGTVILHADVDAFFASVAQRDDPDLRGKPVIVGGGVVMAASYEARRFGVRSGMGGAQARRLCPQAIVANPSWSDYVAASRAVFAVFERSAELVEPMGIEEAFLDLTGRARTKGEARAIAERLRAEVREETGLPITVGVARTKIVAKMAGRAAKPDGLLVVAPSEERAFLHPLRVEELWGIGPKTARRLHEADLRTVGQLAQTSEAALVALLGTGSGRHVHALAHNRDRTPVQPGRPPRSFGAQRSLGRARAHARTRQELDEMLAGLTERVTGRMAKRGFIGRTVVLRLRFADFARATRSHTMPEATAAPEPILTEARALLAAAAPAIAGRGITLIGLSVTNVVDTGAGRQLELPSEAAPTAEPRQGPIVAAPEAARSVTSVTSLGGGTSMRTSAPKS